MGSLVEHDGRGEHGGQDGLHVTVDLGEVAEVDEADGEQVEVEVPAFSGGGGEASTGQVALG